MLSRGGCLFLFEFHRIMELALCATKQMPCVNGYFIADMVAMDSVLWLFYMEKP